MATPTHDSSNVVINIFLATLASVANLRVSALADGTSTLGGDTYREYTTLSGIAADLAAAELSATHAAGLSAALSSSNPPRSVIAVAYDKAGGEDSADAFQKLLTANVSFLGFSTTDVDSADILAAGAAVEADKKHLFSFRTTDTSGLPAALSAMADYEYSMGVYHEATEQLPFAHLASRLGYDPDATFAMGPGRVSGFTANTSIDETVKTALKTDNISFMAAYGTASQFVSDAYTLSGRGLEEMVTVILAETRMRERATAMYLTYSDIGAALDVGSEGDQGTDAQIILAGEAVEPVMEILLRTGRISAYEITFPVITATDVSNANIPVNVDITLARSGRVLTVNAYFHN